MSDATDIRDWAAAKGITIGARGRIPKSVQDQYDAEQAGASVIEMPDLAETTPAPPNGQAPETAETAPKPPPKPKLTERLFKPKDQGEPARRTYHGKRKTLEAGFTFAWGGLAKFLGAPETATGRTMTIQAPVAGVILDDTVAGTAVDRFIQPFARNAEKAEALFALGGPPLLVLLMERNPALIPMGIPLLRAALESYMVIAGPAMAKARARQAKVLESLREFAGPDGVPVTVDDLILEIFGAEFFAQPPPQPETDAA